jgi:hypothetical protein
VHPCTHWQVPLLALWHSLSRNCYAPRVVVKHIWHNCTTWAWTRPGVTIIFQQQFTAQDVKDQCSATCTRGVSEPLTGPRYTTIDSFLMDVPYGRSAPSSHFIQLGLYIPSHNTINVLPGMVSTHGNSGSCLINALCNPYTSSSQLYRDWTGWWDGMIWLRLLQVWLRTHFLRLYDYCSPQTEIRVVGGTSGRDAEFR